MPCGVDHEWPGARGSKSCRFDIALFRDQRLAAIVECKPGNDPSMWSKSKRRSRYQLHGVPVLFAAPSLVDEVVHRLSSIIDALLP